MRQVQKKELKKCNLGEYKMKKITRTQLREIIKEEVKKYLSEKGKLLEYTQDKFRLQPRKNKEAFDLWNMLKKNIQSKGFAKKTPDDKIFGEFEKQMNSLGYNKKEDFIAKGSSGIPEKITVWTKPNSRAIKLQQKKRTDGGWTMILLDGKRIIGWFVVVD